MGLRIDHVVWGAGDLDEAAGRLLERYGLGSAPGGRHPGWGTANRIVPLGPDYLELMAVVDPGEAARDAIGQSLSRLLADGDGLLLWCLATDDLDATAARLGLRPAECLVVEDLPHGVKAAEAAGCPVLAVGGVEDVHLANVLAAVRRAEGGR